MELDLSTESTRVTVHQVQTPSLGDHSYVVVVGTEAVVIDPQRDIERFEAQLDAGVSIVAVCETHIHNDYVSGGFWLAKQHDAPYVLPRGSGAPYPHRPVGDGDLVDVGGWHLRATDTPGHTFHHMSYVLVSPDGPVAAFTGGSMLVAAVGRSDLLGPDSTDELLGLQYASVRSLAAELPAAAVVAPTHGAGSFCSASAVSGTTSTIDAERAHNPACTAPDLTSFVASQKAGYGLYPSYYAHMAPVNLTPADPIVRDALPDIEVSDATAHNATIVDARPFAEYAAGHVTGSIAAPPSDQDATYVGWTIPWNSPLAVVGDSGRVEELRVKLARIGWDNVVGRIPPASLAGAAVELSTVRIATFADLLNERPATVVDARDPNDHAQGMIPGAIPAHVSALAKQPVAEDSEVWVHCQGGYRAAVASGFLERAGCTVTAVMDDLSKAAITLV